MDVGISGSCDSMNGSPMAAHMFWGDPSRPWQSFDKNKPSDDLKERIQVRFATKPTEPETLGPAISTCYEQFVEKSARLGIFHISLANTPYRTRILGLPWGD